MNTIRRPFRAETEDWHMAGRNLQGEWQREYTTYSCLADSKTPSYSVASITREIHGRSESSCKTQLYTYVYV